MALHNGRLQQSLIRVLDASVGLPHIDRPPLPISVLPSLNAVYTSTVNAKRWLRGEGLRDRPQQFVIRQLLQRHRKGAALPPRRRGKNLGP